MAITFKPQRATKKNARLRLGLVGPAGSGKTYTALSIASHLLADPKIVVVDTERGSADKYADLFTFDSFHLEEHSPVNYTLCIREAAKAGYDVIIIDSLSHAWNGVGGALEQVDNFGARNGGGKNNFGAWRSVTPLHNEMVDAILGTRIHVIATMRSKMDYVQEKDEKTGRTSVRKVGLAPVQREGMEYEFDVVGELDQDNNLVIAKTRCPAIKGKVFHEPGASFATTLSEWLTDGAPEDEPVEEVAPVAAAPRPRPATQNELTECETLRGEAVALGFRTDKNEIPPVTQDGASIKAVTIRSGIYRDFIEKHAANGQGAAPADEASPPESNNERIQALHQAVKSELGYQKFGIAMNAAGLKWLNDDDVAAFENAASILAESAVIAEEIGAEWGSFALMVEGGSLRWGE